jgi:hypothetical protein
MVDFSLLEPHNKAVLIRNTEEDLEYYSSKAECQNILSKEIAGTDIICGKNYKVIFTFDLFLDNFVPDDLHQKV